MAKLLADEKAIQIALFQWIEYKANAFPEFALIHHIPNGGGRDPREGAVLMRQGVRPGIPDICWPIPSGAYHGLYIEMKRPGQTTMPHQAAIIDSLRLLGYSVFVADSFESAQQAILGHHHGFLSSCDPEAILDACRASSKYRHEVEVMRVRRANAKRHGGRR